MLRGTLTLLMRSVRADAQKRTPHAFRVGSMVIILLFLIVAHTSGVQVGAPGLSFFRFVTFLAAALITLAGMGHFANAITEEKEEGTLGLLLLADISPLSILLGKSTNRILSAWLIFAAQFPFALLSLTLGGITVTQIASAYLSLAAYLFLIANLALFISVVSRRTGEALAAMGVLSILLHGTVPWLEFMKRRLISAQKITEEGELASLITWAYEWYRETSIVFEIDRTFTPGETSLLISPQVITNFAGGIACFALAWWTFRQIVWDPDLSHPSRGTMPSSNSRMISLIPRPWHAALVWKDFHFIAGGPVMHLVKITLLPFFAVLCYRNADWVSSATGMPVAQFVRWSFLAVLVVELLIYASCLFHVEKKWGTLPTLLMLPYTIGALAYSKLLGCLLGSVPTVIALIVIACWDPGPGESIWNLMVNWSMLYGVCTLLVLCHFTVLTSLIVKWGALPLSAALLLILGSFAMPVISALMLLIAENYEEEYARMGPLIYATGIACTILQLEIGRRISQAAAS